MVKSWLLLQNHQDMLPFLKYAFRWYLEIGRKQNVVIFWWKMKWRSKIQTIKCRSDLNHNYWAYESPICHYVSQLNPNVYLFCCTMLDHAGPSHTSFAVCMYIYIYNQIQIHMHIHMYVHVYTNTYVCMYLCMYVCMYVCMVV